MNTDIHTDALASPVNRDESIDVDAHTEKITTALDRATVARDSLADCDSVLIAFSGGVDSAVVAALAFDSLGRDAIACTAKSETLPAAELEDARQVASEIGLPHEIVSFSELDDANFVENGPDRCYHCRTMRLGRMYDAAHEHGIETVCDGTNASDTDGGHRPGLDAVDELNIKSPLREHGLDKEDVRIIAAAYGLSVAQKPSMACLSSRIPTGLEVTEDRLNRVEAAEAALRTWGFSQFRVRDHDGLARIEIGSNELADALDVDFVTAVRERLRELGFEHVTLDLHGYETGSVSPEGNDENTETTPNNSSTANTENDSNTNEDAGFSVDAVLESSYPTE
ncbi:MAG: TIGR00268 family protein [Haloquadratum walsbyi J07HQW2]|uniref:TIGR00268 family protein n=1 Tax=Haloquadratum walsbyi J07HQW2 TaxID=1238425 RepID=U1PQ42_9EURY|nr:ATP-dependent sacrificial sulfur transferase LarE [Haloquadratum walsbyi]ERG95857.1 MAG: TIGR00268 family protein [Haloquadratum walsbyi J07HQW2]